MILEEDLLRWFSYHAPKTDDIPKYLAIRQAAMVFATVLVANTPLSVDQMAAIRMVRQAVMIANSAIACGGQ